jgi:ABC-type sulfate/molybdate transport systems ATPase subunit
MPHHLPVEEELAFHLRMQVCQRLQERRLSGTIRTVQAEHLAARNPQTAGRENASTRVPCL